MTDPDRFEQRWPETAEAINRMLANKGVPETERDDIVQETAARLIRLWDSIDHSRPLMPLVMTIALNILRDSARRRTKREITLGDLPDRPGPSDVEREGLTRLDLYRVVRAMGRLSPLQRDVLLVEVSDAAAPPGRGPDALKMLRMRARRKLASILEAASAAVGLLALRLRSGSDHLAQSAVGTLAAVAVVATLPSPTAAEIGTMERSGARSLSVSPPSARADSAPGDAREVAAARGGSLPGAGEAADQTAAAGDQEGRPVRVPIGKGGYAEASGEVSVNETRVEVKDHGGPVPVCVSGVPGTPSDLDCPE